MDWREKKRQFFCRFPEMGWRIPYKRRWREARRGGKQQQSNKNPLHLWKDAFFLLRSPPNTGTSFTKKNEKTNRKLAKIQFFKTFVKFCLLYLKIKCGSQIHMCANHRVFSTRMRFTHIDVCKTLMPFCVPPAISDTTCYYLGHL
jgi:hypothetical protein